VRRTPIAPLSADRPDLDADKAYRVQDHNVQRRVAAGRRVLGHPARCVAWLANALGARGSGLRAGDVVLSGALHRMVPVRPGDSVRAEFAHLGSVSARFSRGGAG
jgi:2-keto-4-pentenoate hydratase